jgi:hypothetical protein
MREFTRAEGPALANKQWMSLSKFHRIPGYNAGHKDGANER